MISRHPLKQADKKQFKHIKATLTKADKTKASKERIKNFKAQNLPKKNAQELGRSITVRHEADWKGTGKVSDKKRYSFKYRRALLEAWRLDFSRGSIMYNAVTPKRPVPGTVPEKFYKVLHIDVQKLDAMEFAIMKRESELKAKTGKKHDVQAEFDRDDEEAMDKEQEKNPKEDEMFTVVWLLIKNAKFECQWVNADDMYFL